MATTTMTTTTKKPPNTSICGKLMDLVNAGGTYLKSVCLIETGLNYNDAKQNCLNNGMQLFIINDADTEKALADFGVAKFGAATAAALWINGQRTSSTAAWQVDNNGVQQPLYANIMMLGGDSGDCLETIDTSTYKVRGFSCTNKMDSYCEYTKS